MHGKQPVYQIYTYGQHPDPYCKHTTMASWGLHALSEHKESSILHAKMLILNPSYEKIQVEKISFCEKTGAKQSKTVKIFKKTAPMRAFERFKSLILTPFGMA